MDSPSKTFPPPGSTPSPPDAPPPVIFTWDGVWRGIKRVQPFTPGIVAYGLAFGLVAVQAKLSILQAVTMSTIVYSGSAQLAAVGVLSATAAGLVATLTTLVGTILVMNARYLLFSATLRPWLAQVPPLKAYTSLFFLGDGGWLISMRAYEDGERDAGFVLGTGLGAIVGWVGGTWLGGVVVDFAPDPKRLGFDFMLVAFAAAMMAGMFKGRRDIATMAVAALVAVPVAHVINFGVAVIAAGVAGGVAAYFRAPAEADA